MAETNLYVSIMAYGIEENSGKALVFVTDMETGKPVKGVDATVFGKRDSESEVKVVGGPSTTNELGVAEIDRTDNYADTSVVIREGDKLMYIPDVRTSAISTNHLHAALVLDRRLLQPGETLYVKGTVS